MRARLFQDIPCRQELVFISSPLRRSLRCPRFRFIRCSPVDTSRRASRLPAHDSGPMWIAAPSSQWTCTIYCLRFASAFPSICPFYFGHR